MEVCIYCNEPRGDQLSCCGENHWEEVDEDEDPEEETCNCCGGKHGELGSMDCGTYGGY